MENFSLDQRHEIAFRADVDVARRRLSGGKFGGDLTAHRRHRRSGRETDLHVLPNILFISCSYSAMRLVPPKVPSPQLSLSLPSLLASWITVESAGDHWLGGVKRIER